MPHEKINGIESFIKIDGTGESLVFIHGLGIDSSIWDDQTQIFANSYETVCYDLRGHGLSDAPETGYSYRDYSDDLVDLIEVCCIPPVHLVGLSMGGAIAFKYARENPEKVRSLTLIGTHLAGYTAFEAWPNLYKIAKGEGREAAREAWKNFRLFESVKFDPDRWEKLCRMIDNFSCAPWLDPNPKYGDTDDLESCFEVTSPVLLISGTGDSDFRPVSELFSNRLADSRFASINSGHLANFESPEVVNEAMAEFLRGVG